MLRLWVWPFLIFASALVSGVATAKPAPARIVAVGDLHGDYDAWEAIARGAGVVDAKGKWAGGSTVLVQMGDVVDRGPDSLKIIHQLMRLQREARSKGGQVIALVGNHEAMNMTRDLRYVHPGEYLAFTDRDSEARRSRIYEANKTAIEAAYRSRDPKMTAEAIRAAWIKETPLGMLEHQSAWGPEGEVGKWVIGNPAVAKVGDSLFVHGGISAKYATMSLGDINLAVATALKRRDETPASIINDGAGPLWYRGLVTREPGDEATVAPVPAGAAAPLTIDQEIDLVLTHFGVKRIVVGHTPSLQGIISNPGGTLWRTDSAISRAYNGKLTYLEIVGDQATSHEVTRPAGKPWG
ncbi:metallophosphoesterase [Sphingomonas sp. RB56-2]|uniref:Metallophosphoesterase n=1 Tax=Sphingomonas brevis TaxID=2908206 RepID=A0ABT0S5R9_9SPHN|nr:metallophosphoesterase [Sphingomonas brevis]MCL6739736.1 metallophosphoesterase [Sphingomonas brevis]